MNYVTRDYQRTRRRKPSQKKTPLLLMGVVIVGVVLLLLRSIPFFSQDIISPIAGSVGSFTENPIEKVIQPVLAGKQGTYAVVVKNLKTGQAYNRLDHQQFESASLYKLWVMVTVYDLLEKGKLHKDDVLEDDIASLNETFNIASEAAELTDGKITLTVGQALSQMITISHNYAALLLTKKVGLPAVASELRTYGLSQSTIIAPPRTNASDIAKLLTLLYQGKVVSPKASAAMLDLLKKQQINDRIPKYLPKGTVVAHKTGELDSYKHDVGIVYAPSSDYIFVVLSSTHNQAIAAETIAQMAKHVDDYFASQ